MKSFDIPSFYKSEIITELKNKRKSEDKLKRDFSPSVLKFGDLTFVIARHFGFCYGVENAIEIIYKTIAQNMGKRIFLLSEMIHNPKVNEDLQDMGVQFLMDTNGNRLIDFQSITKDDIVVIPAFGTTIEIENEFRVKGIDLKSYDTTCPFVEKVWNRSEKLGADNFTVLIHGKPSHEETRATFSHAKSSGPAIVINDINETRLLAQYILGQKDLSEFFNDFAGRTSENFNPELDLKKIGVVNQTTMLATDTQEIADYIKNILAERGDGFQFADTRDTLCYATSDNQKSVYEMLKHPADFAVVVGGFKSSNTSHLVELCEHQLKTFHVDEASRIESNIVEYLDFKSQELIRTKLFLNNEPKTILVTSGASSPDAVVDEVIQVLITEFDNLRS